MYVQMCVQINDERREDFLQCIALVLVPPERRDNGAGPAKKGIVTCTQAALAPIKDFLITHALMSTFVCKMSHRLSNNRRHSIVV